MSRVSQTYLTEEPLRGRPVRNRSPGNLHFEKGDSGLLALISYWICEPQLWAVPAGRRSPVSGPRAASLRTPAGPPLPRSLPSVLPSGVQAPVQVLSSRGRGRSLGAARGYLAPACARHNAPQSR